MIRLAIAFILAALTCDRFALAVTTISTESPECTKSIRQAAHDLEINQGLNILQPYSSKIRGNSTVPGSQDFQGSNHTRFKIIAHPGAEDYYSEKETRNAETFMNDDRSQLRLANQVMARCLNTVLLTFSVNATGRVSAYYRMPKGKIQKGKIMPCTNDKRIKDNLNWGTYLLC